MPPSDDVATVTLSKLQTAERQLDTAIWLWFHHGEIVSIIQLTDAAIGVLDDLLFHHKRERPVVFCPKIMAAFGTKPKEARPLITKAADFAKHARLDPEEGYEYKLIFAEHYIYMTIMAREQLLGNELDRQSLRNVFVLWYGLAHPENFDPRSEAFQGTSDQLRLRGLDKLSRIEFLKKLTGERFIGNPPKPDL